MTCLSRIVCGLVLLFGLQAAFAQPLVCSTSATANIIRAGGLSERTADLLLTCTGGNPFQGTVPPVAISINLNAGTAGRLYTAPWTEALLIVDEPAPGSQLACAPSNVQGTCSNLGDGEGEDTYDGSAGHPNVFQGQRNGNTFLWPSVPFDPPGAEETRIFRFTNLKVNAADLIAGPITATISIQGQLNVQIQTPTRTVANVQQPLSIGQPSAQGGGGQLSGFSLTVLEQFGAVFKTRSAAGTGPADQNEPGLPNLGFETGFRNSSFPNVNGRGNLGDAGLADTGTRLRVAMANIPSTVTITAPLTIGNNIGRLIAQDGPYSPLNSGILANQGGVVIAVYEIVTANPNQIETFTIPFTITGPNGSTQTLSQINGAVQLGPIATPNSTPQPSFPLAAGLPFQVNAPTGPAFSIVTQSLPNAFLSVAYNQTVLATGGTTPYTFRLEQAGTLPPGLSLSNTGAIAGTPTTVGKYTFTVRATDAAQQTAARLYTVEVGAAPPPIDASPRALQFSAFVDGPPPPVQAFTLQNPNNQAAAFRVNRQDGPNGRPPTWLSLTPHRGSTPARIKVSVDQTGLAAGEYTARIGVTEGTGSLVLDTITVTLKVSAEPPKLARLPEIIRVQARAGQPEKRREYFGLRNVGGGGSIPTRISTLRNSSWIAGIVPSETNVPASSPRFVAIDIDTTGLREGFYRDVIRAQSNAGTVEIPIVLWIVPAAPILDLSTHGLFFLSRQGERNPVVKRVAVINKAPNTTLQWQAEAVRGAEWLAISPTSGQVNADGPNTVRFGLRPEAANLSVGRHYALVRISDTGALQSPQYIVVVVQIVGAGDPPVLDFDPGGIVLTSAAGGARATRDVQIRTPSTSALDYSLSAAMEEADGDGENWLSVTPTGGSINAGTTGAPGTITVTADPSRLDPGIYRGQIVTSAGARIYALNVTFIVTPADAADAPVKSAARQATCVPKKLALAQTALVDNFNVPAGWPASLSVELRNDCGAAISNGAVIANFSNGDPPLSLQSEGSSGIYSATWQPGIATPEMNITIRAAAAGLEEATAAMVGGVAENKPPVLFPNGTIHINYHPVEIGGPLAPGMPAEIYGQALASVAGPTDQLPLTKNFKGTSVLIGPQEAPLFFVSPGQVNVQVPWELTPNRRYQVLVLANGEITTPDFLDIVPLKPGITNTRNDARELIAQHLDFSLVTPANPAKRGELLVMYLVGLGATTPSVASGAPSPGNPPALPNRPVTLSIGGIPANVLFAGMTPSGVGLFQINFYVPENAPLNTPLDVVVTQDGIESNVTKLTVAQ